MLITMLTLITLASMGLIVYNHAGYPLLLRWIAARSRKQAMAADEQRSAATPSVSLVIPAFNEAKYIADKIRNVAALDYPAEKLNVIIACDGCTDDTAGIARRVLDEPECALLEAEVREFEVNRGKVALINDVVKSARADLVAMSDVSALISMDALKVAAAEFSNAGVGVVSGHYRLLTPGSVGEAVYWDYQNTVRSDEAALGATMGAPGAFYMVRREAFQPLEPDTINDDFILPMRIVAAGYRAAHSRHINAVELEGSSEGMDQRRRRRIAAGNMQQLLRLKALLAPRFGGIAFAFASGKALRVLVPYLMVVSLVGCWALAPSSLLFAALAMGQTCVYLTAALAPCLRRWLPGPVKAVCYLVNGHFAGLVGSMRYLLGLEQGRWSRVGG